MKQTDKLSIKLYLDEIGNESRLSNKEEAKLATRIQNGEDNAMEKLLKANLKFVVSIAKQYQHQGIAMEDLISEGNIGLLYAAKKFAGNNEKRFAPFAAPFIRKQIEQLLIRQGRDSQRQIATKTTSIHRKVISLEAPIPAGSHNSFNLLHILKDANAQTIDEHIDNQSDKEALKQFLKRTLDQRQQQVISLFFGIGCEKQTLIEIAELMGFKRERVRQIRNKALQKIRKAAKNSIINK